MYKNLAWALIASISIVSKSAVVFADSEIDNSGVEASGESNLEEITVTAQRRSENLERTPVAISVISSDELAKQAIVTETDLQSAVPGLTVRATQNSNQLNYAIRGQTVDAFTGSQPAVLPYVNEVQVPTFGSSAFYDLQSVQVLKGPQGTLFGKNSTGGAVLFTTAAPTDKFEGYISGRGGNYGLEEFEGAINAPIVDDKVLFRLAGFYEYRDGFQNNLFNSSRVGTVDRYGSRASLVIKVTDQLTNSLVVDYAHSGGSNTALVLYDTYGPGSSNSRVPVLVPTSLFYSPALDAVFGAPGLWASYLAQHPGAYPAGLSAFLATQSARGPYSIDLNNPSSHLGEVASVSNVTTFDVGGSLHFKNIFGFTHSNNVDDVDYDGSPFSIEGAEGYRTVDKQLSDEFQVSGDVFSQTLSYVSGLYWSDEDVHERATTSVIDLAPVLQPSIVNANDERIDKSYAAYAQGTLNLTQFTGIDGLGFTAGLRETHERVLAQYLPGSSFYDAPYVGALNSLSQDVNKLSWQFGLQEQIDANLMLYAVSRRSFRSGGFNTQFAFFPGLPSEGGVRFDPEIATDFELGAKFQGDVAGRSTRLNVAVFDQWVTNVQRVIYTSLDLTNKNTGVVVPTLGSLTIGVPEARIQGLELDGEVNLTAAIKLGASLAYTNARFTKNQAIVFGTVDYYGPYPDTPRTSGTLFAEFRWPLSNSLGILSVRGDVFAQTKFYFSSQDGTTNPGAEIPGYGLVNFRLALDDIRGSRVSVSAYVKNAFDRTYYVGGLPTASVFAYNTVVPGDPRTVFGEVKYRF